MNKSVCNLNISVKELIESINNEPAGTAFINDEQNKLCGIVTDGDLRRLFLKGKKLEDKLTKSDLGNFIVAKQGESIEKLIEKTNRKIRIIPIVNEQGELVDYFEHHHKSRFTPIAEPNLSNKELVYLTDAYTSTWISSRGKYIDKFEQDFSNFCGISYGIATSNGTVAIHLALKALDIKEGDEVILPDLTFAATINAVILAGATPVIVDIDADNWTISSDAIEQAITKNTKAIIPVHVYGQVCDMVSIMEIANKHNLFVIEDCAEAHGATMNNKKVGSFGHISTFSFFANKIITTGEGGMCITNSNCLNERMRMLRDHGMNKQKRYWHDEVGFNYRMTNLQAAIGCAQLEKIEYILKNHKDIEEEYKKHLSELKIIEWQKNIDGRQKVVWLVSCLSNKREEIAKTLKENNIDFRPFFYPLSAMPIYAKYSKGCPVAKEISDKGFNLPTVDNIDFNKIKSILSKI